MGVDPASNDCWIVILTHDSASRGIKFCSYFGVQSPSRQGVIGGWYLLFGDFNKM